jgi:hypothetical protein
MTTTAHAPAASTQASAPAFRWLFPTGLFSLLAIGLLWAIRPSSDCYELCPNGQAVSTDSPAIVAGGIMIALYAAIVAVALTVLARPQRTIVLWLLTGGLVFVFLVAVLVSLTIGGGSPVTPIPYDPTGGVIVN